MIDGPGDKELYVTSKARSEHGIVRGGVLSDPLMIARTVTIVRHSPQMLGVQGHLPRDGWRATMVRKAGPCLSDKTTPIRIREVK